jgi:uncharacterized protein YggU (UPF0235/DUF167 family)
VSDAPWKLRNSTLVLSVRLTPKSSSDTIDGIERLSDGRAVLKVRVRALPRDGEANRALLQTLAQNLKLPISSITLAAGATGRVKTVGLSGDPGVLQARLEAFADPASNKPS